MEGQGDGGGSMNRIDADRGRMEERRMEGVWREYINRMELE